MIELQPHAARQARSKGWEPTEVLGAALDPDIVYPSRREGQERRIRGEIVAVVDVERATVVTCYRHCIETPLRPDQRPLYDRLLEAAIFAQALS